MCSRRSTCEFSAWPDRRVGTASVVMAVLLWALAVDPVTARALHDPTRPSGWQATSAMTDNTSEGPATLRLQGVFSRGGMRTAMISGQHVAVGDAVGGAQVVAIDNNRVTLMRNGQTIEITTRALAVKSPTQSDEVLR